MPKHNKKLDFLPAASRDIFDVDGVLAFILTGLANNKSPAITRDNTRFQR